MDTLYFDLSHKGGRFKPLNATNGGPWHKRHAIGQNRSTLEDYRLAGKRRRAQYIKFVPEGFRSRRKS